MSEWLDIAIDFLEKTDLTNLPLGRTEIFVDKVFANVMEAQSLDETAVKFEIHKRYMDIQIDVEGTEIIQIGLDNGEVQDAYDEETDFGTVSCGRVLPASWDRADLSYAWEKNRISRVLQRTKISI